MKYERFFDEAKQNLIFYQVRHEIDARALAQCIDNVYDGYDERQLMAWASASISYREFKKMLEICKTFTDIFEP